MMTPIDDDKMLDAAFADARAPHDDMVPSDAVLDRIMLNADSVLAASAPLAATAPRQTFGAFLSDLIGGWPQLGGLAAATVAGLWIGVVQPTAVTDLSTAIWGGTIEVPLLESDLFAGLEG